MIAALPLPTAKANNLMRWVLFSALGIGLLSLSAGSGTLAYFTTQVQSNNNTFTAGNLRFNISDSLSTTGQYPSVGSSLSLLNMKPGDAVYAPIKLSNTGNIDAKFGIRYTTSSVLASTSDLNGGVVSAPSTTQLIDTGRTVANGLTFAAPAYAAVNGSFVLITGGMGQGEFQQITSVVAPDTLNTNAFTAVLDATTTYDVVPFAGTAGGASTSTVLSDLTGGWTINQWAGYTVTAAVGGSSKIVSNTPTTLTVSPAFGGGTPAAPTGTYTINRTNLAAALNLGILGRGLGSGTDGTGAGASDCKSTTYASPAGIWSETAVLAGSPAKALGFMVPGGAVLNTAANGTAIVATTGSDILCMQVNWPDGGAPTSLTTQDNAYNGANPGAYSTNINFIFDGI